MKIVLFVSILVLISGCGSDTRYVVYRDLPATPSITVMGLTWSARDAEYAREIESLVISLGIRTMNPPAPKDVEVTTASAKGDGAASATEGEARTSGRAAGASLVERYRNVTEATSTHIITADWSNLSIRVIEKESGQVIASQPLRMRSSIGSGVSEQAILSDILRNLGFKVQDTDR